jgi:hypothetical protein
LDNTRKVKAIDIFINFEKKDMIIFPLNEKAIVLRALNQEKL